MTILGNIFGRDIEKYDVVEISDDGGKTWQDYASITCPEDVKYVRKIIASQGDHWPAKYRIRR